MHLCTYKDAVAVDVGLPYVKTVQQQHAVERFEYYTWTESTCVVSAVVNSDGYYFK